MTRILHPKDAPRCAVCNELVKLCTGHPQPPARERIAAKDLPRYQHRPGCPWVLCLADDCECGEQGEGTDD